MLKRIAATCAVATLSAPAAHAVPIVGGQGLTPSARAIADYVSANYPAVQSIGGVRPCDRIGEHCAGRAVDIMVGNLGLGDAIYADLLAQRSRFNITYCLFRVPEHFSHVHCSVAY